MQSALEKNNMKQANAIPDHTGQARAGQCRHCTHCNVQTGMGWNPVFYCEREGHAAAVNENDTCGHFEREPGSDDA